MNELDGLYRDLIIDHAKRRHGKGLVEHPDASASGRNPLCGDEVTLQLTLADDGSIAGIHWDGSGCSISQASASILATEGVGLTPAALLDRAEALRTMLRTRDDDPDEDVLGDAIAFAGVGKFPMRVKCAMLAWTTAEEALAGR